MVDGAAAGGESAEAAQRLECLAGNGLGGGGWHSGIGGPSTSAARTIRWRQVVVDARRDPRLRVWKGEEDVQIVVMRAGWMTTVWRARGQGVGGLVLG